MAALALGDEHPAFTYVQILQPQSEDLASAQATQHHGLTMLSRSRRNAAIKASTSPGERIRGSVLGVRINGTPWRGRDRSRRVAKPRGTGLVLTPLVPWANKNAYRPDTLDNRRRIVRAETPDEPSILTILPSPSPNRCAVINPTTSATVTRPGGLSTNAKNVFRSCAVARNVFGRDRAETNRR